MISLKTFAQRIFKGKPVSMFENIQEPAEILEEKEEKKDMAEKFKMVALMSFKGNEGFIKNGEPFEVNGKSRAEELAGRKLAKYAAGIAEDPAEDQEEGIDIEDLLKSLNSHAKIDQFAADHNLTIPSKEDAKLDERKAAIEAALNAKA